MKIRIICVGKIKETFYSKAIDEYSKRLSSYIKLDIIEVADEKTKENLSQTQKELILNKEGRLILDKIKDNDYVIALDIRGKSLSSEEFAMEIEDLLIQGKSSISFIIGGSLGLSTEVLKRSEVKLSFSKFTFPHQLMRVILLEQIYRAFKIIRNEPYHK